MEFILLAVIVGGFAANMVLMRFFFKRLANKVTFSASQSATTSASIPSVWQFPTTNGVSHTTTTAGTYNIPNDAPANNEVMKQNDEGEIEFNEQVIGNIPADVRIEVEGGDTQVPPGFEK